MSQQTIMIAGAVIIIAEQIISYLPCKSNSTVQLIINVAKTIFGKKG